MSDDDEIWHDEDGNDMLDCTHCNGDGMVFGDELNDPMWYLPDEMYSCKACNGTGERRHQTIF
jgi:DnaJ-class molecular chaperone